VIAGKKTHGLRYCYEYEAGGGGGPVTSDLESDGNHAGYYVGL
jgi:hypothetical protein